MPGKTKYADLRNPKARASLPKKKEPHWFPLSARATLGWHASGRWFLRTYVDGKYSRITIGDELSFEAAESKAWERLDAPAPVSGRLTVRQAMDHYIDYQRNEGKSVVDLISRSRAWILPTLGNKVVADLTATRLGEWRAMVVNKPAMKRTGKGKPQQYKTAISTDIDNQRKRQSSANRVLTYLKAALNHAYDVNLVPSNAAWGRKLKPFKDADGTRVRYLSVAEATRLINAADPDFRSLVEAALQTGCRYSELTRLEVADFNPDVGTVHIRKSKSGNERHVVLTEEGADFFKQVCAGRRGLIFRRGDGKPWKASQQARPMVEACQRAGIEPLGVHALRHTVASHSVMNGVPLIVVAKNLGHANTRMVEKHYGHLERNYFSDAIRQGAPRFRSKRSNVTAIR